ncbi:hypothetical protein PYW07_000364 [Mythimna separata]|uniref:Uncharacterized protein n=1 Tax=Mythimna separata TaxID=271217 RepID=A0AAD8E0C5_MYTSE|nr:hypothetical protein PYW07_000364 [Mythimna separata]
MYRAQNTRFSRGLADTSPCYHTIPTLNIAVIMKLVKNVHSYMKKEYKKMQRAAPHADLRMLSDPVKRTADAIGADVSQIRNILLARNVPIHLPPSPSPRPRPEIIEVSVEVRVANTAGCNVEVGIVPRESVHSARIEHVYLPHI